MEIRAKISLNLPNQLTKITLKYDTFEPATYDSYLIASLVKNTSSKKKAMNYIDEITGKGSLNAYFKQLYEEISEFTKDQINSILTNSLYPVTIIDKKHQFRYYPVFNVTQMDNKVYEGDLSKDIEKLKSIVMPKDDSAEFRSIDLEPNEVTSTTDNYNAEFNENDIKIEFINGKYYPVSKKEFSDIYHSDVENLGAYKGEVGSKITDGNWKALTKSITGSFAHDINTYKDSNGTHSILYAEYIKTIEIINVFGIYFYKDTRYDFSSNNKEKCEEALKYLLKSNNINEYKTKSLLSLLSVVDEKQAQKAVTYILSRKSSKEISEFGLKLIKNGLEKNWDYETLTSIKQFADKSYYNSLYRIDSDLGFSDEDLMFIDDIELDEYDKSRKQSFIKTRNNIIKQINEMIGDISNSGIREKIKSLEKTDLKNTVKKFVDKRIGHNKKDYDSMDNNTLKNEFEEIKSFYNNEFVKIKKVLKDNEL